MEPPNERQSLSAASRTIADVEPVRVGWHRPAAQSGRHGAIFRECSHTPAQYRGLDLDTVHLLGGLALLAGFYSRWAAALLVLVCLGTAFGVHLPAGDQDNMIHFYKNLVMTGGFLYVIAFGPGGLSLDRGAA
jgi:hypothetical protein